MIIYYIYHIPNFIHKNGKIGKIGCTEEVDAKARVNIQGYTDYEILETYTDIIIASNRERQLQKEYGYPIDRVPYYKSRSKWGSVAGKVGGNKKSDLRNKKCSELGKKTGPVNVLNMIKKRKSYNGQNNPKCKITETQAQEILDYYTQLVNSGHRKYGLLSTTYKMFPSISKRIVQKICLRTTWKHLSTTTTKCCSSICFSI